MKSMYEYHYFGEIACWMEVIGGFGHSLLPGYVASMFITCELCDIQAVESEHHANNKFH